MKTNFQNKMTSTKSKTDKSKIITACATATKQKQEKERNHIIDSCFFQGRFLWMFMLMLISIFLFATEGYSNNLSITGGSGSGSDLSFSISWDNSWNVSTVPYNYDAVWVFIKMTDCSTTNWSHADLDATATNHTVSGGSGNLQVDLASDNKGVFIRRNAAGGPGTVSGNVTLRLTVATGDYNFKVFGIEMVRILNEDFQVGDGAASGRFSSVTFSSEAAITSAVLGGTGTVDLPAAYPKGWNAFYCMKYEITNEQYVDFLNTLTYTQQATRTEIAPNSAALNWAMTGQARNRVKMSTQGVNTTDNPPSGTPATYACDGDGDNTLNEMSATAGDDQNVPISRLSWGDLVAYLDWACFRPMSDLEFEKICRGPLGRISGEYAWGNNTSLTVVRTGAAQVSNYGSYAESSAATLDGRCVYGAYTWIGSDCYSTATGIYGPARAGITTTSAVTTRVQGGVSYYGALDMSGNLYERVVNTNTAGSSFTGTLGDGALDASGNATNADWPSYSTASGGGFRGGYWRGGNTTLQISDRSLSNTTDATRLCTSGGRGVR